MKTIYYKRFNAGSTFRRRAFFVIAALIAGILVLSFFKPVLFGAFAPVWKTQNALGRGFTAFFTALRDKDALVSENMSLRERLGSYDALNVSKSALESHEEELLGHFGRTASTTSIAAGVLIHPPETPYDIIIVDAGSNEGVTQGLVVSLAEGGAIGRVIQTTGQSSKVELFTSSGLETNAYLERNNIGVKLVGLGGGTFKITLPRDTAVEVGDRILMPGLHGELVGVVRGVELASTDSAKVVRVSGVANISSVRFVTIH